jgi:hypothetical protein
MVDGLFFKIELMSEQLGKALWSSLLIFCFSVVGFKVNEWDNLGTRFPSLQESSFPKRVD